MNYHTHAHLPFDARRTPRAEARTTRRLVLVTLVAGVFTLLIHTVALFS